MKSVIYIHFFLLLESLADTNCYCFGNPKLNTVSANLIRQNATFYLFRLLKKGGTISTAYIVRVILTTVNVFQSDL